MNRLKREYRKRRVLKWVNAQRVANNLNGAVAPAGVKLSRLPKGTRGAARSCVIARALNGSTGSFQTKAEGKTIVHPWFVSSFITDFDNKQYPELYFPPYK